MLNTIKQTLKPYLKNTALFLVYSYLTYLAVYMLFHILIGSYAASRVGLHHTLVEYESTIFSFYIITSSALLFGFLRAFFFKSNLIKSAINYLKNLSMIFYSAFILVLFSVLLNFHGFSFFGSIILKVTDNGGGITKTYQLKDPSTSPSIDYEGKSILFENGQETVTVLLKRKLFIYAQHIEEEIPLVIYAPEVVEVKQTQ